jgi:hypothetical protein
MLLGPSLALVLVMRDCVSAMLRGRWISEPKKLITVIPYPWLVLVLLVVGRSRSVTDLRPPFSFLKQ